MSHALPEAKSVELHMFCNKQSVRSLRLLFACAHFHRTGAALDVGHTVNLGIEWEDGSACTHALVSLPYMHGPQLEKFQSSRGLIRCLWLIPITEAERAFKASHGLEALESMFEEKQFDYANPWRASVV